MYSEISFVPMGTSGGGYYGIARYNIVFNNESKGIVSEISYDIWIYGNVVYDHTNYPYADGIVLYRSPTIRNKVLNNTLWHNGYTNLRIYSEPEADGKIDNVIKNNITLSATGTEVVFQNGAENDGTYGSNNEYDNNSWGAEASNFLYWGATGYSTYNAWETACGGLCSDNKNGDANFKNSSNEPTTFSGSYGVDFVPNNDGLSIVSGNWNDSGADLGS
ncbi:MAG: hypothetical protein ACFFB5_23885, partial [Promethearchaeota archaeon]